LDELLAERAQIGLLVEGAGSDQHAVGAEAEPLGALLGVGEHVRRQQVADAVELAEPAVGGGKGRRPQRCACRCVKACP
jgi:hypothetical protein